ncbi:MAG: hypothetical protein KIT87_12125 [Anaerolineae bacterium]|nr:hypothetical protein [Anaerolineae bacterium]
MRILFFGMEGRFSRPPLIQLLQSEFTVCGVVVPVPPGSPWREAASIRHLMPPRLVLSDLPLLMAPQERTIVGLAWDAGVPVFEVRRLKRAETQATLAALQPDALAVACFPRLLPPALLSLAPHGAFNIHPSRLPQLRGPEPLFWTFHDDLDGAGVTVHRMDVGADTGSIAAQTLVHLPDGIGYAAAQRLCAEAGSDLLLSVLRASRDGILMLQPQDHTQASSAPVPGPEDFVITAQWSARRAYNFARGVAEWGQPIVFDTDDAQMVIREVIGFLEASAVHSGEEVADAEGVTRLRCADGVLLARV